MAESSTKIPSDRHMMELFGANYYPPHHALWFLKELGCVENLEDFSGGAWESVKHDLEPERVALLDTPVAWRHPNLRGAIDHALVRDFSVRNEGSFVIDEAMLTETECVRFQAQRDELLANVDGAQTGDFPVCLLNAIKQERSDKRGPSATRDAHNNHGTAMAGLIAGRPAGCHMLQSTMWDPSASLPDDEQQFSTVETDLPFAGVNPFNRLIPVSLPTAPSPEAVFNALEYVRLIGAKVVVIASSWQHPDPEADDSCVDVWKPVRDALNALSENGAIIVCAAGNEGETSNVYPATLAHSVTNLYQVAACGPDGVLVSYSPIPLFLRTPTLHACLIAIQKWLLQKRCGV